MADFTFNRSDGLYRHRSNGRVVSAARISEQVDLVSRRMADNLGTLAERLRAGTINDAEWITSSADEIRNGHRAVAIIAGGGRQNMTPADWGFVGSRIRSELAYLAAFGREIEDRPEGARLSQEFVQRARSYGLAIYPTYEQALRRRHLRDGTASLERNILDRNAEHCADCIAATGAGLVPIGTLIPIGERECISRCRCRMEYVRE